MQQLTDAELSAVHGGSIGAVIRLLIVLLGISTPANGEEQKNNNEAPLDPNLGETDLPTVAAESMA